jgi:hypothetical protein
MMRHGVTKSSLLAVVLATVGGLCPLSPAHADESCTLRGEPVLPANLPIFDAPSGGVEIGHFTGAKAALSISTFPEASGGRAGVETSGFRIKGFVRVRDLPVYAARPVPVYAGHVWISEGRRVSVIGGGPGRLHAEKTLVSPISGYFHGWAPCDAFTLGERVPSGWTPPGGARGYVLARERVNLYSAARGDVVTTIERASGGPPVLLWSMDREASWVHVEHHGDVTLDAWAKAEDVSPLPPGETMDQLAPSASVPGTPRIQVQGPSKIVRVGGAVSIRGAASDAASVIGSVEAGVEVMVLDTVAGWASVVPKGLAVMPSGPNQFWVKVRDLGL